MLAAKITQLRERRLQAAFVAIDRGDADTGPGEAHGNGPADTAARPRHRSDAAG